MKFCTFIVFVIVIFIYLALIEAKGGGGRGGGGGGRGGGGRGGGGRGRGGRGGGLGSRTSSRGSVVKGFISRGFKPSKTKAILSTSKLRTRSKSGVKSSFLATNKPSYKKPFSNSYGHIGYSPGIYSSGKSSSGINSLFAKYVMLNGLSAASLGMYFKLNNVKTHTNNTQNRTYKETLNSKYVVIRYHYIDSIYIAEKMKIDESTITLCKNNTFCGYKTEPLCLKDGKIYCVINNDLVDPCIENASGLQCFNTTTTLAYLNSFYRTLESLVIQVPCTNSSVSVTTDLSSFLKKFNSKSNIKSKAIQQNSINQYCIAVQSSEYYKMTNQEFLNYLQYDDNTKKNLFKTFENVFK